jgi:hypothetical protein
MKKLILISVCASLLLTGCLGELIGWGCDFVEDDTHCYQTVAVQNSNPDECEEVETDDWPNSNPPKDKCYLIIAENTGDASVCDNIVGGPGSYTREECRQNVLETHGTLSASASAEIDEEDEEAEEDTDQTDGLSDADKADVKTVVDAATGQYMDFLEADIESETDPGKKAGLQAYQGFLQQAGEKIETAQTTVDQLTEIKRIFIDTYDSANDIENMNVNPILDPGLFDKIKDRLFGSEKLTGLARENADAENALVIYEAMLNQQKENDFLKQDKLSRLSSVVSSKFRDAVTGEVVDGAKEVAEGIAGTAFGAVTHVGEALQAFQDEAQHQIFLGLARAYNRRREALEQERPNTSPEELHKIAVEQVKLDPYQDNTQLAFVKHGNILENQDCKDTSNPLCIDGHVWWTAMDKTFQYNKAH